MKNIIITVIGTGIQMIFEISFYRKLIMEEEKLKQGLTKKVEKKKLSIDSLLATLVFWAAIIASIALTICFFFGEKIDPLRIILEKDHECKGGWRGIEVPGPPPMDSGSKHTEDAVNTVNTW